jgi:hypothetical protein
MNEKTDPCTEISLRAMCFAFAYYRYYISLVYERLGEKRYETVSKDTTFLLQSRHNVTVTVNLTIAITRVSLEGISDGRKERRIIRDKINVSCNIPRGNRLIRRGLIGRWKKGERLFREKKFIMKWKRLFD